MAVLLLGLAAAYGRRRSPGGGPRRSRNRRREATASEPGDRQYLIAVMDFGTAAMRSQTISACGIGASLEADKSSVDMTHEQLIEQSGCGVVPERAEQQVETRPIRPP